MTRAQDIFNKIVTEKEQAIDAFISDYQYENLFIDFKQVATQSSDKSLHFSDRKNYAKAISGFGNSEGGVIVWGVECKNGPQGDVPTNKKLIENPHAFASKLEAITSGCSLPPHNGVRNEAIISTGNKGFVITFVPKSENTPHQAISDKAYYYIRVGSNFVPAPHGILAGMFV